MRRLGRTSTWGYLWKAPKLRRPFSFSVRPISDRLSARSVHYLLRRGWKYYWSAACRTTGMQLEASRGWAGRTTGLQSSDRWPAYAVCGPVVLPASNFYVQCSDPRLQVFFRRATDRQTSGPASNLKMTAVQRSVVLLEIWKGWNQPLTYKKCKH